QCRDPAAVERASPVAMVAARSWSAAAALPPSPVRLRVRACLGHRGSPFVQRHIMQQGVALRVGTNRAPRARTLAAGPWPLCSLPACTLRGLVDGASGLTASPSSRDG